MSPLSVLQSYCADAQINVICFGHTKQISTHYMCKHRSLWATQVMRKMTGTHNSQLKSPAQDNEHNNNQSASQRGVASELPVMKTTACSRGVDVKSGRWANTDVERETAFEQIDFVFAPSSGKINVYLLSYSKLFIIFMKISLKNKL